MLTAAALLPIAGCTGRGAGPQPTAPPDPDAPRSAAAAARERALITQYDQALLADPTRAALLRALRDQHAQHLAALESVAGGTTTRTPAAPGGSATAGTGSPATPPAPAPSTAGPLSLAERAATNARLAQAEREAAAAHARDALPAGRALAAVLASLAASESSHPLVLT